MEPSPKTYGITSPISLAEPRPEDWQQTEELIDALKPHGVFENEDELNHRSVFVPYNVRAANSTRIRESIHAMIRLASRHENQVFSLNRTVM